MGLIRPATPGFLVTLLAAVLLAIVSFSVPYFKSVFFLKASLKSQGIDGTLTFGTLGYCLELPNGTTCTKPSVGYELDINSLVGNKLPIEIPNVAVKWLTYTLVLHIVALVLAGIAAFFGLLAHVREVSMACFSSCISGFGAAIALLAFIFDLAFFFIAKSRINSVQGGSASIGIAVWLTLAAWLCLFFAGCFFGIGRCCIRRRSRGQDNSYGGNPENTFHHEQMRLEAVKAEADRKARQAQKVEVGLPPALSEMVPLTKSDSEELYIDDGDKIVAYRPAGSQNLPGDAGVGAGTAAYSRQGAAPLGSRPQQAPYVPGYAQAAPGTRAVDDYYNPRRQPSSNTYPPPPSAPQSPPMPQAQPNPRRQASGRTQASGYAPSGYSIPPVSSMPVAAIGATAQYGGNQYGHNQYASAASAAQGYGHSRDNTYQSAASQAQYTSDYNYASDYNTYSGQPSTFNADTYSNTAYMQPGVAAYPSTAPYGHNTHAPYSQGTSPPPTSLSSHQQTQHVHERGYTLGGTGYDTNTVPVIHEPEDNAAHYAHYSGDSRLTSPYSPLPTPQASHITTAAVANTGGSSSAPRPTSQEQPMYDDSPPMYDDATAQPPGEWSTKQRS